MPTINEFIQSIRKAIDPNQGGYVATRTAITSGVFITGFAKDNVPSSAAFLKTLDDMYVLNLRAGTLKFDSSYELVQVFKALITLRVASYIEGLGTFSTDTRNELYDDHLAPAIINVTISPITPKLSDENLNDLVTYFQAELTVLLENNKFNPTHYQELKRLLGHLGNLMVAIPGAGPNETCNAIVSGISTEHRKKLIEKVFSCVMDENKIDDENFSHVIENLFTQHFWNSVISYEQFHFYTCLTKTYRPKRMLWIAKCAEDKGHVLTTNFLHKLFNTFFDSITEKTSRDVKVYRFLDGKGKLPESPRLEDFSEEAQKIVVSSNTIVQILSNRYSEPLSELGLKCIIKLLEKSGDLYLGEKIDSKSNWISWVFERHADKVLAVLNGEVRVNLVNALKKTNQDQRTALYEKTLNSMPNIPPILMDDKTIHETLGKLRLAKILVDTGVVQSKEHRELLKEIIPIALGITLNTEERTIRNISKDSNESESSDDFKLGFNESAMQPLMTESSPEDLVEKLNKEEKSEPEFEKIYSYEINLDLDNLIGKEDLENIHYHNRVGVIFGIPNNESFKNIHERVKSLWLVSDIRNSKASKISLNGSKVIEHPKYTPYEIVYVIGNVLHQRIRENILIPEKFAAKNKSLTHAHKAMIANAVRYSLMQANFTEDRSNLASFNALITDLNSFGSSYYKEEGKTYQETLGQEAFQVLVKYYARASAIIKINDLTVLDLDNNELVNEIREYAKSESYQDEFALLQVNEISEKMKIPVFDGNVTPMRTVLNKIIDNIHLQPDMLPNIDNYEAVVAQFESGIQKLAYEKISGYVVTTFATTNRAQIDALTKTGFFKYFKNEFVKKHARDTNALSALTEMTKNVGTADADLIKLREAKIWHMMLKYGLTRHVLLIDKPQEIDEAAARHCQKEYCFMKIFLASVPYRIGSEAFSQDPGTGMHLAAYKHELCDIFNSQGDNFFRLDDIPNELQIYYLNPLHGYGYQWGNLPTWFGQIWGLEFMKKPNQAAINKLVTLGYLMNTPFVIKGSTSKHWLGHFVWRLADLRAKGELEAGLQHLTDILAVIPEDKKSDLVNSQYEGQSLLQKFLNAVDLDNYHCKTEEDRTRNIQRIRLAMELIKAGANSEEKSKDGLRCYDLAVLYFNFDEVPNDVKNEDSYYDVMLHSPHLTNAQKSEMADKIFGKPLDGLLYNSNTRSDFRNKFIVSAQHAGYDYEWHSSATSGAVTAEALESLPAKGEKPELSDMVFTKAICLIINYLIECYKDEGRLGKGYQSKSFKVDYLEQLINYGDHGVMRMGAYYGRDLDDKYKKIIFNQFKYSLKTVFELIKDKNDPDRFIYLWKDITTPNIQDSNAIHYLITKILESLNIVVENLSLTAGKPQFGGDEELAEVFYAIAEKTGGLGSPHFYDALKTLPPSMDFTEFTLAGTTKKHWAGHLIWKLADLKNQESDENIKKYLVVACEHIKSVLNKKIPSMRYGGQTLLQKLLNAIDPNDYYTQTETKRHINKMYLDLASNLIMQGADAKDKADNGLDFGDLAFLYYDDTEIKKIGYRSILTINTSKFPYDNEHYARLMESHYLTQTQKDNFEKAAFRPFEENDALKNDLMPKNKANKNYSLFINKAREIGKAYSLKRSEKVSTPGEICASQLKDLSSDDHDLDASYARAISLIIHYMLMVFNGTEFRTPNFKTKSLPELFKLFNSSVREGHKDLGQKYKDIIFQHFRSSVIKIHKGLMNSVWGLHDGSLKDRMAGLWSEISNMAETFDITIPENDTELQGVLKAIHTKGPLSLSYYSTIDSNEWYLNTKNFSVRGSGVFPATKEKDLISEKYVESLKNISAESPSVGSFTKHLEIFKEFIKFIEDNKLIPKHIVCLNLGKARANLEEQSKENQEKLFNILKDHAVHIFMTQPGYIVKAILETEIFQYCLEKSKDLFTDLLNALSNASLEEKIEAEDVKSKFTSTIKTHSATKYSDSLEKSSLGSEHAHRLLSSDSGFGINFAATKTICVVISYLMKAVKDGNYKRKTFRTSCIDPAFKELEEDLKGNALTNALPAEYREVIYVQFRHSVLANKSIDKSRASDLLEEIEEVKKRFNISIREDDQELNNEILRLKCNELIASGMLEKFDTALIDKNINVKKDLYKNLLNDISKVPVMLMDENTLKETISLLRFAKTLVDSGVEKDPRHDEVLEEIIFLVDVIYPNDNMFKDVRRVDTETVVNINNISLVPGGSVSVRMSDIIDDYSKSAPYLKKLWPVKGQYTPYQLTYMVCQDLHRCVLLNEPTYEFLNEQYVSSALSRSRVVKSLRYSLLQMEFSEDRLNYVKFDSLVKELDTWSAAYKNDDQSYQDALGDEAFKVLVKYYLLVSNLPGTHAAINNNLFTEILDYCVCDAYKYEAQIVSYMRNLDVTCKNIRENTNSFGAASAMVVVMNPLYLILGEIDEINKLKISEKEKFKRALVLLINHESSYKESDITKKFLSQDNMGQLINDLSDDQQEQIFEALKGYVKKTMSVGKLREMDALNKIAIFKWFMGYGIKKHEKSFSEEMLGAIEIDNIHVQTEEELLVNLYRSQLALHLTKESGLKAIDLTMIFYGKLSKFNRHKKELKFIDERARSYAYNTFRNSSYFSVMEKGSVISDLFKDLHQHGLLSDCIVSDEKTLINFVDHMQKFGNDYVGKANWGTFPGAICAKSLSDELKQKNLCTYDNVIKHHDYNRACIKALCIISHYLIVSYKEGDADEKRFKRDYLLKNPVFAQALSDRYLLGHEVTQDLNEEQKNIIFRQINYSLRKVCKELVKNEVNDRQRFKDLFSEVQDLSKRFNIPVPAEYEQEFKNATTESTYLPSRSNDAIIYDAHMYAYGTSVFTSPFL